MADHTIQPQELRSIILSILLAF